MKKYLVRISIGVFGLVCVASIYFVVFVGDLNHYENLDVISDRIDSEPTPEHIRDLLNYPADGAYAYYKGALIGAVFSKHPEVFHVVTNNLQTEEERRSVERLVTLGGYIFEHHPELKPENFDQQFSHQDWLKGEYEQ